MLYDPARLLLIAGPCSLESDAVNNTIAEALRDLPVACANLEAEPSPAISADSATRARSRTRSSANRRGP